MLNFEKFDSKKVLHAVFFTFSLFGLLVIFVLLIVYLLQFKSSLALKVTLIVVANELVCGAIKLLYKKERPIPLPAKNLFQLYSARGFPSVHTARVAVFAAITILLSKNLAVTVAALLLVAAVASSRVYLKKHDWIDVLGGLAIGAIIGIGGLLL